MTLFHHLSGRARHTFRTPVLAALAFWVSVGTVAVVAAQSTGLETPSPAKGRAQVISQGMTNRPALRSAWRVVERVVPPRADARPSDRLEGSAGFLLADSGPIFVTDQDTKQRYRLAPGEAQFVPIGANQTWASLGDGPATAYTLELSVRDNVEEAGGEVIYHSGSFGMEEGDYDLDLLRDTLPYGERTKIDGTEFPVLIFVTQGQIDVISKDEGDEPIRLYSGQAGAFDGDLEIATASKNDAIYVAAVVGASIGGGRTSTRPTPTTEPTEEPTDVPTAEPTKEATAEPTEEPTDEPTEEPTEESEQQKPTPAPTFESRTGSSEIKLEIRLCPAGMRPESFEPDQCGPAQGDFSLALVTPFDETLRLRHANRYDDNYVRWSQLKSGTYQLVVRKNPDGYDAHSLDGYLCCTDGGGYEIRLGRGEKVIGTIYFFLPE
jgi:hypothetical protein